MLCKFSIVGESEKERKKAAKLKEKNEKKNRKRDNILTESYQARKRWWKEENVAKLRQLEPICFFCSSCCAIKPRYRSLMKLGLWNRRQRHNFLTVRSIVRTGRFIGFPYPSHVPMSHVNLNVLSLHRSADEKKKWRK